MKVIDALDRILGRIVGTDRTDRMDDLRDQLNNLDGQEDSLVARLGDNPWVNDLIMISVFKVRDEKADVLGAMGRHSEARALRADTAMRRKWTA